jgi:hypothetical protein
VILNRSLSVNVSGHARDRLLERFGVDLPQALKAIIKEGKAVYEPKKGSFRVTWLDMVLIVRENGREGHKHNSVVTVLYKQPKGVPKVLKYGTRGKYHKLKVELDQHE